MNDLSELMLRHIANYTGTKYNFTLRVLSRMIRYAVLLKGKNRAADSLSPLVWLVACGCGSCRLFSKNVRSRLLHDLSIPLTLPRLFSTILLLPLLHTTPALIATRRPPYYKDCMRTAEMQPSFKK